MAQNKEYWKTNWSPLIACSKCEPLRTGFKENGFAKKEILIESTSWKALFRKVAKEGSEGVKRAP